MNIFSKRKKHDQKMGQVAKTQAEHAQAEERAKKFDAYFKEILDVTVKHDMTIGELKLLTMSLTQNLEQVFGSRKVKEFMDKPQAPAPGEQTASEVVVQEATGDVQSAPAIVTA